MTSDGLDHIALRESANELVSIAESIRDRLAPADTSHMQHYDFADRTSNLGRHLHAALMLSDQHLYPSAFAVVRTAFEHQIFDRLLFLARKLVQTESGVDQVTFDKIQAGIGIKDSRVEAIEWLNNPSKKKVRIIFRGVPVESPDLAKPGYDISVYYAVLHRHMPLVGHPRDQELLDDGLIPLDQRLELANEQRDLYNRFLKWESLKEGLSVNGLVETADLPRLDVHYRFLSTFTHATQTGYHLVGPGSEGSFDHYSEELVWLYVTAIAAAEITDFMAMTRLQPAVGLADEATLNRSVALARSRSAHMWFPGGTPDRLDFVDEANRKAFRRFEKGDYRRRSDEAPESLSQADISYYSDPMARLIKMHSNFTEMTTGFAYTSPWPRSDAQFRR